MDARYRPFIVAGAVVALDRVTKLIIERNVTTYDVYTVIPGFFEIVHTQNRGIAFGLFNEGATDTSAIVLIVFSLIILGFIASLLWHYSRVIESEHWTLRYGLALILGGAVGNVLDRIMHGSVTDFLDFFHGHWHFPIFNVADSAITVGAGLLLLNLWVAKGPRQPKPSEGAQS